jgi:hypothetical protein
MQGFGVASTHKPCTKGLWLWSQPVERTSSADGKRMHVVLVDCEGIDAFDQVRKGERGQFMLDQEREEGRRKGRGGGEESEGSKSTLLV